MAESKGRTVSRSPALTGTRQRPHKSGRTPPPYISPRARAARSEHRS